MLKIRDSQSDLPPEPPYGSNWAHKFADFVFLPYISFIIAFIALECIESIGKPILRVYIASQIYSLPPTSVGTLLQLSGSIIRPFFRLMIDPQSIILLHC